MSARNFEVVRRHYLERHTTPPHGYFSGRIPLTVFIEDEITIKITNKTKDITLNYSFPEGNKILKFKVCRNGQLLIHEVLILRTQEIDPKKLQLMNLSPMKEVIYPIKIHLDRDYDAGDRVQLTIELICAFKTIPELKDFFLPCIEFIPASSRYSSDENWPKTSIGADSSLSYVLPAGFKAIPMTSDGPDFTSESEKNSYIGWLFRKEKYRYLRYWVSAQIAPLYFLLLYLILPSSALLVIIFNCLKMAAPPTIIAMLCGSYLVARYYLYDKTLMPPGGDLILTTIFITTFLSVISEIDLILLIIDTAAIIIPWMVFSFQYRETRRKRKRNDELVSRAHCSDAL